MLWLSLSGHHAQSQGRAIEVVNLAENGQEDLLADLTAILYSRLYGQRGAKRKTESIIRTLEAGESEEEDAIG